MALRHAKGAGGRPKPPVGEAQSLGVSPSSDGGLVRFWWFFKAQLCATTRNANEARPLGQFVSPCTSPYYYQELELYRLLEELRDRDELTRFYERTIAPLARYDREHNTELVHTLDIFFAENANASSAARRLGVHRNTLRYRLERMAEITGQDLRDADARFALQLGIRIHHLIRCFDRRDELGGKHDRVDEG